MFPEKIQGSSDNFLGGFKIPPLPKGRDEVLHTGPFDRLRWALYDIDQEQAPGQIRRDCNEAIRLLHACSPPIKTKRKKPAKLLPEFKRLNEKIALGQKDIERLLDLKLSRGEKYRGVVDLELLTSYASNQKLKNIIMRRPLGAVSEDQDPNLASDSPINRANKILGHPFLLLIKPSEILFALKTLCSGNIRAAVPAWKTIIKIRQAKDCDVSKRRLPDNKYVDELVDEVQESLAKEADKEKLFGFELAWFSEKTPKHILKVMLRSMSLNEAKEWLIESRNDILCSLGELADKSAKKAIEKKLDAVLEMVLSRIEKQSDNEITLRETKKRSREFVVDDLI